MIKCVSDFSNKSWNHYTGPADFFRQKNIFFGYNGKGKSALAYGILQEIKLKNEKTDKNYRLFDKDYVNNSLLLKDGTKIQGVVANFGEKNVDIEKLIIEKEAEKHDVTQLEKECSEIEKKIKDEIDLIYEKKRRESSIKKKNRDMGIDRLLNLYDKDLQLAKDILHSEEELRNVQSTTQYEQEMEKVRSIQLPNFLFPSEDEVDRICEIMTNTYEDNMVPSSAVVQWISDGLSIHKERDDMTCQFCGGPLHIDKIEERLDTFLSDRKQQDQAELEHLFENLSATVKYKNGELAKDKKVFIATVDNIASPFFDDINNCLKTIEELNSNIEKKLSNFNESQEVNAERINQQINQINNDLKELNNIKKNKEAELQENIQKFNVLVKGSIALDIKDNLLIKDNHELLKSKSEEIKNAKQKNNDLDIEITKLKNSKSTTVDFANFLNDILEDLGIGFYLEVDNKDYVIKHRKDNIILTVKDISEGESNLLALLIFYYELFDDDKQKKFKNDIKYIIIDDPISSIDDINRIYILELLKNILECDEPQIFIFTHVWEDFIDLCYGRGDKKETLYRFYEVMKNSDGSYLREADRRETPYMHNFKDIYDLSLKKTIEDMNDCEIYHYPNIMRKVLEEFMKMKVLNANPTRANIRNVEVALCGDADKVSHQDRLQIPALLDTCNILSHRNRRDPEQILKSAKYLMRKIKDIDPNHFHAMTGA